MAKISSFLFASTGLFNTYSLSVSYNIDYYLDKLDRLSQGVNGLKNDYQSILDDMIEANKGYWPELR